MIKAKKEIVKKKAVTPKKATKKTETQTPATTAKQSLNTYHNSYMNEKRATERDIGDMPEIVNSIRRESCRCNLQNFLNTYLPMTFSLPFSAAHLDAIGKIQKSVLEGGLFALALPRSFGKTSLLEGAILWAMSYGHRRFIVAIGASAEAAEKILDSVKTEYECNEKLEADFPEICYPIQRLAGAVLRAKTQTSNGELTRISWTKSQLILPSLSEETESSGVILEARGLTGNLRGMKHKLSTGESVRPSFIFIDDPQTDSSAASPSQCDTREELIKGAVLGLAGTGLQIAGICCCTIIAKDDLSDRLLDNKRSPEWQGSVTRLVGKWPDAQETLWQEYAELWKESILAGDNGKSATEFYRANREAMDKGAEVAWQHKKNTADFSALQHAENLLLERGQKSFNSEYQNNPVREDSAVYSLTINTVLSRCNGLPYQTMPETAHFISAGIDINQYGLNFCVSAFDNHMTGSVIDYGKYPEGNEVLWTIDKARGMSESQAIANGLYTLCDMLKNRQYLCNGQPRRIDGLLIDCGYMTDSVLKAILQIQKIIPIAILPARGRGSKGYRQTNCIGKAGDNWHKNKWDKYYSNVIVHNADYFKMQVQKGFMLKPGTPGSISIFGHERDNAKHLRFAENICSEVLTELVRGDICDYYNWQLIPGRHNDLLDALALTMIGASMLGASHSRGEASWSPARSAAAPATATKPAMNYPQQPMRPPMVPMPPKRIKGRARYTLMD